MKFDFKKKKLKGFFFQGMYNLLLKGDGSIVQKTHIARTHDEDDRYELLALPETETKLSLLGNLFLSNGKSKIDILVFNCNFQIMY